MDRRLPSGLAASLRSLRLAAGMTQETLADRAGVSARTISDVERGLRHAVYVDTAQRLADALGLPEADRSAFFSIALDGEGPGETSTRGTPNTGDANLPLSQLPWVPTRLFGRSKDIDDVAVLLTARSTRLLTLTGPGGIGKTRLALDVVRHVAPAFPDGVHFVSLGEITDAALVAPMVAATLGVRDSGLPLGEAIASHIGMGRVLFVLDTFEHMLAAGPTVYELMIRCPAVSILATSRSGLRLRGEREYPVRPLELPPTPVQSVDELAGWPGTALFIDRMEAIAAVDDLDDADAAMISEICIRLEGLPLAIELAAARVRHLSLSSIRDQLENRLQLLVGGPLDMPRRQRTISDTIAWSYDLLEPDEQLLFRRLSLFVGGWDLKVVEGLLEGSQGSSDSLAVLSALIDQSLVVQDRRSEGQRYDMLDMVREYGFARLAEEDEADEIGRYHSQHYLAVAEAALSDATADGLANWFNQLTVEQNNMRKGLAWALGEGEPEAPLRYVIALWPYWRQAGEFTEGRRWCDAALALRGQAAASIRAKAIMATEALTFPQGDVIRIAELSRQSMVQARLSNDPMDMRNALTSRAMIAMSEGRYAVARDAFAEALEVCQPLGLSWPLATSYLNLGLASMLSDALADARLSFESAQERYRSLGDVVFAARATDYLSRAALMEGTIDVAERLGADALSAFAKHDERQGVAEALDTLAAAAAVRGNAKRTARLRGAAASIRASISVRPPSFDEAVVTRFTDPIERRSQPEEWAESWAYGERLSLREAVTLALE